MRGGSRMDRNIDLWSGIFAAIIGLSGQSPCNICGFTFGRSSARPVMRMHLFRSRDLEGVQEASAQLRRPAFGLGLFASAVSLVGRSAGAVARLPC
eukprot:6179890-Pleurochrysis_carterae.AAC.1